MEKQKVKTSYISHKLKELRLLLPVVYLITLLLGFLIYLFSKIFPSFNFAPCITISGQPVCTYLGIYIATVVSLAGYIIVGTLFQYFGIIFPEIISYLIVVIVNILIYGFVGLVLQKVIRNRDDKNKFYTYLIIALLTLLSIFVVLLIAI